MVNHAIDTGKLDLALQVQRWFEVDMPYGDVKPNGTTFAIMIHLALRMLKYTQRDRAVRRYWAFARGADLEEEVLADPVLSERELGLLSEVCDHSPFESQSQHTLTSSVLLSDLFLRPPTSRYRQHGISIKSK
jgi:hypothetical protein